MIIKTLVAKTGTQCNLRCKKCGEFNPHLRDAGKYFSLSAGNLLNDVYRIISGVERVETVHVAGGEPFLHNDLIQLLCCLAAFPRIGHIEVVTNGTVLPDDKTLGLLSHLAEKVIVLVSDYSRAGIENQRVVVALEKAGVKHVLRKEMVWKDKSDVSFKNYKTGELPNIAKRCGSYRPEYFSLINGVITAHCPTSGSLLHYLGLHDKAEGHFVDLNKKNEKALLEELTKLNLLEFTPMCNWCVQNSNAPACVAGEQIVDEMSHT